MAISLFSETNNEDATKESVNKSEEKITMLLSIRDEFKNMSNILKTMVNLQKENRQDIRASEKLKKIQMLKLSLILKKKPVF